MLHVAKGHHWDQIIDAAAENGGQIGVQANKYEGYSVWINALIEGAGGQLVENADKGVDLDLTIDSEQGAEAAKIIEKLASSEAAPADLSVSNEGTAGSTFGGDNGSFMVNWTYIFHIYDETTRRSPRTSATPAIRRRSRARSHDRRTAASASASASSPMTRSSRWRPPPAWSSRRTRASTPR